MQLRFIVFTEMSKYVHPQQHGQHPVHNYFPCFHVRKPERPNIKREINTEDLQANLLYLHMYSCINGPLFFREFSINNDVCLEMIKQLFVMLEHLQFDFILLQDARIVRQVLQQHFGYRIISYDIPSLMTVPWPPQSLDLTLMDFWFLGYLKSKIRTSNPRDTSQLKDAIKRELMRIPSPIYVRH